MSDDAEGYLECNLNEEEEEEESCPLPEQEPEALAILDISVVNAARVCFAEPISWFANLCLDF